MFDIVTVFAVFVASNGIQALPMGFCLHLPTRSGTGNGLGGQWIFRAASAVGQSAWRLEAGQILRHLKIPN